MGDRIVFADGRYDPQGGAGRRLLAHELAHVVQQRGSPIVPQARLAISAPDTPAERAADAVAGAVSTGAAAPRLTPIGATLQRQALPATSAERCVTTYSAAGGFRALVDLVRAAETRLIACGYTTADDRIHVLRGIYYGTTWSADYLDEGSPVRNLGFQTYTASTTPDDPRSCLDCGLFDALRQSQDVNDDGRRVDFGHLIIGMDARRSWTARNVPIPSQGGTGLAIATWVGDLGGGAAMLSVARITNPRRRAVDFFRGTDFGGSINLEGDVAGYLVGADLSSPDAVAAPVMPGNGMIADALESYLLPAAGSTGTNWDTRCQDFLRMMGGAMGSSGTLTNRVAVVSGLASQIEGFACWYLVNRLRQTGRLSLTSLRAASGHIGGASQEVATVFVDALEHCVTHPGSALAASGSGPAPTPPSTPSGACQVAIAALEVAERAQQYGEAVERRAREIGEELEGGVRDLRRRFGL